MREMRLNSRRVNANVQDITSANDNVSKIRRWSATLVLRCPLKDNVHVAVAVDHLAAKLDVILKANVNVALQLLDEYVEGFP